VKSLKFLAANSGFILRKVLIAFIILSFFSPSAFTQSKKELTHLYSDYLKGLFNIEEGNLPEALKSLKRAKSKDPNSLHIRLKIAFVLIRLDRLEEAENILREAKNIDPDNLDISLSLIFVYSYRKKDKELEQEYENLLKKAHTQRPKDVNISQYLAQFYFYKKRPKQAIEIYEKLLENNPNYVDAFFWLGYLYEETGRQADAIAAWKEGLKIESDYAPILNSLGYIYTEKGINLDLAEEMLKKALAQEPDNGAYLDSLGWLYFKKRNFKAAENYLIKAISYTKDPEIYEHLGDLYREVDDLEKSIGYYKEGLLYFPNNKNLKEKFDKYGEESKVSEE